MFGRGALMELVELGKQQAAGMLDHLEQQL
jgi:hypothetical protein